jgi:hypothetical protein
MPWSSVPTSLNPSNQNQLPQSFFPANTGGTSIPTSLANLSSGLGGGPGSPWYQNLYNELGRAYGKGTGQILGDMITKGLFNPSVANALMQAMEPTIQRGYNDVLSSFSAEGGRFSSAGAIGAGDYMSQARLGQTAQLAQLFELDQSEQLQLLQGAMPTLHTEEANRGSGIGKDILGGLETIGGIAGAAFGLPTEGLIAGGFNTLAGGLGGGGGGQNPQAGVAGGIASIIQKIFGNKGGTPGFQIPSTSPEGIPWTMPGVDPSTVMSASAGGALGGFDPFSSGNSNTAFPFSF